jgi:hypothetical protein
MSYNGWSNRETWLVNVWFNPESRDDVEHAKQCIDDAWGNLPDFMRDFCDINAIDWAELLAHFDDETNDETNEE